MDEVEIILRRYSLYSPGMLKSSTYSSCIVIFHLFGMKISYLCEKKNISTARFTFGWEIFSLTVKKWRKENLRELPKKFDRLRTFSSICIFDIIVDSHQQRLSWTFKHDRTLQTTFTKQLNSSNSIHPCTRCY